MSTTIHTPVVGPRVTNHPSYAARWSRGVLLLALLAGIAVLWSAGQAYAAPVFDVGVTHSPDHVAKNDRALDYQVALTNTGTAATTEVGDELVCSSGIWTNNVVSYGYQWLRNGVPIAGADAAEYTVVAADDGTAVQCDVTATNPGGSAHDVSAAKFPGTTPASPPVAPASFNVGGGFPTAGQPLTCAPGTWSGAPTFRYQWYRNGVSLGTANGADTASYTVQSADIPGVWQCRVSGTNASGTVVGYSGARATSPAPSPALPGPPTVATRRPQIGPPPVTVAIALPSGTALRPVDASTTGVTGAGWTCATSSSPIVCTRSDAPTIGAAYPTIGLAVRLDGAAPDTLKATATVSGGGAPTATGKDTLTLDPAKPFGVDDFTTSVVDADGHDYTQAGGHPFTASATFDVTSIRAADPSSKLRPVEDPKTIVTKLPPGFIGNPQAVQRCTGDALVKKSCPPESQVGTVFVVVNGGIGDTVGVYNMVPQAGHAAEFAFNLSSVGMVYLYASVRSDGDYGVTVSTLYTTQAQLLRVALSLWGTPADPRHDAQRCVPGLPAQACFGGATSTASLTPFLTNPATECTNTPPVTTLSMDSWQHPGVFKDYFAASPLITGCDKLTFEPTAAIAPSTTAPDKPTGLDVDLKFPTEDNAEGLAPPALKKAVVTLPEGMTINPAGANGLEACGDAALKLKSLDPTKCPDASKIGTVTAKSPVLKETLSGGVYIRSQNSVDPESGEMFRIALVLANKERGISIRLPGSIRADKDTGQLVTTFDNNPELPVESIKLRFKAGPRAPLATPATCGKKTVDTVLTSWGKQTKALSSTFTVDCTAGLGWFGPYFSAGTISPQAGASSPFALRVNKPDGQSDLNGIALSLPEGLLANLKGNVGTRIGTATVAAGPGSDPFWLDGPVVLEGPYGDAPFSLRVTVPAIAGPFNLGDVVVRQKIYVDPHDAHVTVVSDPLPTIVKGVPVRLQSLNVDVDKPGFMINPTSCAPKSIGGTLAASTGQTASVASRFQVGGCQNLPLAPKLSLDLIGKKEVKRGKHPKLSTTLTQQPGESGLKKVAVRLPLSLALDPDNAQALCKPEQAAAKACPAESIIGKATAVSPVLNRPLTGDVFFVEGTRQTEQGRTAKTMPKLWVALRGEVALDVWADSSLEDSKYLVTTFGFIPDAPISSFKLDIDGGQHGILVVTGKSDANLCQKPLVAKAQFDGQNGKRVRSHPVMGSPCRFRVQDKTLYSTRTKVRVSGIGAGKLALSGKGVKTARRTIKRADVASITAKLTSTGKRAYKGRKAVRLKVSFNPSAKGEKSHTLRTTVKRAKAKKSKKANKKSSSTRSQRSR